MDDFLEDASFQRSCCLSLIQIGESVNKLSLEFVDLHKEIDWVSVIGFRNIAVHRYESLDNEMAWEIIIKDVPRLKSVCEGIQRESG